jgi:hypothetical protein
MTIADTRSLLGRTPNVDIVRTFDAAMFMDRLVERVGGLAADRSNVAR